MSGWYPMDRFTPGDGDVGEPPEDVNVITGDPDLDEPEVWCDDCDGVNGHFPGCVWGIAEEMAAAAGVPLHPLPPEAATSAGAFRASAAGQAEARLARALDERASLS